MSIDPLGQNSVVLAAPLDLYLTSVATLDVFEDGERRGIDISHTPHN